MEGNEYYAEALAYFQTMEVSIEVPASVASHENSIRRSHKRAGESDGLPICYVCQVESQHSMLNCGKIPTLTC